MKIKFKCNLCGDEILTNTGFASHISNTHGIKIEEYYARYIKKEHEGECAYCGKPTTFIDLKRGYHKFCSKQCSNKYNNEHSMHCEMVCKICNFTITAGSNRLLAIAFQGHIKKEHGIENTKDYYDKYLKKPGEGFCSVCGKPTTYDNLFNGYRKYCLGFCSANKVKAEEYEKEHKFTEEKKQIKETRETELKNYIQELKDRVHEFDWDGERNSWVGGTKPKYINTKDNLLVDNSETYIDGQCYNSIGQCITEHYKDNNTINENKEDLDEYNDIFWL